MTWNIDIANIGLMVLACALAYILPFELVLLSYAFLGPAHYLTQISWMHDRQYFADKPWLWLPASVISILIILVLFVFNNDAFLIYILYAFALAGGIGVALSRSNKAIIALIVAITAGFFGAHLIEPAFTLGTIILLPTVIHIYVFTGAFMLFGAMKSRNKWGIISFAVFLICGGGFFIFTPADNMFLPAFVGNNITLFAGVADYLADVLSFNGAVDSHAMLGFLSFAYTYHYLNWFSKAEIIKWHQIPRRRLVLIVMLYAASIILYLIDYNLGFIALLFLSILHVILEFPLNAVTFKSLFLSACMACGKKQSRA
ncbi:MAG: hypothetical protein ACRBCT_02765 [Alphaproteobacteria bacterium]